MVFFTEKWLNKVQIALKWGKLLEIFYKPIQFDIILKRGHIYFNQIIKREPY